MASTARWPVRRHTLDNGLRVVLHPDPALPLVAINLWYHVGSKNEQRGRTGFAHLFEHMLFQGSRNVGTNDHFRHVQQVGGVANGSTWYDRTNFFETLPAQHLELGLWLESDRLGFLLPALSEEKLQTQREVVINERRERIDNQPYGRAFERLQELLFPPAHPYHWPVIGYMEDIAAATLEEVQSFFRTYYVPGNAVLTLAGDLVPEEALEKVETWLGEIPAGAAVPPVEAPLPPLEGERREILEDDVELARVYISFRCPRYGEPSWYAGDLLATVLSGGKSSPLYQELVYERQIAQDVSLLALPTELVGSFFVVSTAKPGVDPARVEEVLHQHLARAARGEIADADLERALNNHRTAYFSGLQTLDQRADLLSRFTTFFDEPERIGSELERYLRLGRGDLAEFAAAYLDTDRRAVVTVVSDPSRP